MKNTENLRLYQDLLYKIGVKQLTFERYITIIENGLAQYYKTGDKVSADILKSFFHPMWQLLDDLYPKKPQSYEKEWLKKLDFILDSEYVVTNVQNCYSVQAPLTSRDIKKIFNTLPFIHDDISKLYKIFSSVDKFGFNSLVTELHHHLIKNNETLGDIVGVEIAQLKEFYSVLVKLDEVQDGVKHKYDDLCTLPIFKAGNSFISSDDALLPGNFTDPIGYSKLIDTSLLDFISISFIENKLGVKRQSIDEYVRKVVPEFIGSDGPNNIDAYRKLISILAENASLLNNIEIISLLKRLPIIPMQNGEWSIPEYTYFRTDELISILGENKELWISEDILPDTQSVKNFVNSLGVRKYPSSEHLVERMIHIAESFSPDSKSRKVSEDLFYELCRLYRVADDKEDVESSLDLLTKHSCFPVIGDLDNWYSPDEVHAPYSYQAFESQVKVLDFKSTPKLETDVLNFLGVVTRVETNDVINHLLFCIENDYPAHIFIYTVLSGRVEENDATWEKLENKACIYNDSQKKYFRPNQIYTNKQSLGKYTSVVPEALNQFKPLFNRLGVKDNPEACDYIDIILDIVDENYPKQRPLKPTDLRIYQNCMKELAESWVEDQSVISDLDLQRLEQSPVIINVLDQLHYPYDLLIDDSEWYKHLFENDQALCRPAIGFWDFYNQIGVKKLSEVTKIELDFVDFQSEKIESEICALIQEKQSIILRCLHDQTGSFRKKTTQAFLELSTLSYNAVRILATTALGDEFINSPPKAVKAYYDLDKFLLRITRPIDKNCWLHIFQAIFHPLMPSESSASISKLALVIEPCMSMSLDDAHERLTAAGIPDLEDEIDIESDVDLTSSDFDDLGSENDINNEYGGGSNGEVVNGESEKKYVDKDNKNDDVKETEKKSKKNTLDDFRKEIEKRRKEEELNNGFESESESESESEPEDDNNKKNKSENLNYGVSSNSRKNKKSRNKQKKLWDRKLISYVRQRSLDQDEDKNKEDAAFKLSVEVASRELVCQYEIERGREPEEMAQTHPGYDVISRKINTNEVERYIEIKGTSGEWKDRGVSLSRRQFLEAQDNGDKFWLYVVEHAFEKELARVYAIQNPANIIDSFIYDGGWRDAVVDESADPTKKFVEGVQVRHDNYGIGHIIKVESRGLTSLLHIHFLNGENKMLPLNLKIIKIYED